ncbi:putative arylformamidase-like [Tropilaelaps mercedesae]|uniref:Putative arylformamidase-like n=1 Tax=Tropilaelaps mercedesae TaxID=418985 RepID=A0A1V9X671_9ACAR|nr:putative arylformamidase-like [Tropilaelaps mercedesae]
MDRDTMMDPCLFDEAIEREYMPSKYGFNLQGKSRMQRYFHLCYVQNERTTLSVKHISYGPDERQGLNVMYDSQYNSEATVLVFVHGGYWIEGDRHMHNFIANGLHIHNVNVVSMGYRLAGKGADLQRCIDDVILGIQKVQEIFPTTKIHLAGHSAGTHLILCALTKLRTLEKIGKVFCVSGIYSLEKIANTSIGVQLQLNKDQAQMFSVSPQAICYSHVQIKVIVGQYDPPAFQQQAQEFAQQLRIEGYLNEHVHVLPNEDHFSLIENLFFEDSALTQFFAKCCRA